MRELAHVVKNLSNDYEVKELIDSEIKELENSLKKMEKCYEYFQHGVAPIQKKLDDTLNEIGYLGTFGKNATKNFKLTLKSDTLLYEPLELIFPYKDTLSTPKTISSSIS